MSKLPIVLLFVLFGCAKNYKLSKTDIKWNPYKGGELLIFHNNKGGTDTIFVIGIEKGKSEDDPLAFFPNQIEVLSIVAKHKRPIPTNSNEWMEDSFLELSAGKDNTTLIEFKLLAKNAWFYSDSYYVNELDKLPETSLILKNNIYNDVIIIEPQESIKKKYYKERDEFVTKIYWSKSKGYIRYDLKDDVYWELQAN